MPESKPKSATVRHTPLDGKVPDCLSTLDNVCSTAAKSTEVQASPITLAALGVLASAVTKARASLTTKQSLAQDLLAATKTLKLDFGAVKTALDTYETAVNAMAEGDAAVINRAGLLSRAPKTSTPAIGQVTGLRSKPGKQPTEAIVSWPRTPGATAYAIEINTAPDGQGSAWTALGSGTSRRRVVKGATPSSQFQARVAALRSDGTTAEWSDPILVTTR